MDWILRSRWGSNLLLIAASAAVPAASVHFLMNEGTAPISGTGHLLVMAVGASVAAVASLALMARGLRSRDGRAVVAGGAFATMTLLLAIHGLATPGVLLGPNGVVALAGGTALPVGAAILSLAALPAVRRPENVPAIARVLGAFLAALAVAGVVVLLDPRAVPSLPKAGDPDAYTLGVVGLLLFGLIAQRAVRTFALTRRTTDLIVVVGAVWLGVALYPALLLAPGGWGWWMGHLLEFLGVALVGIPLALDARRGAPSHPTAGDLPAERLVAEAESFLGGEVRALLHRLDRHDRSTEEHTRRVATWAVALGESLGLRGGRLRELALAGILHDIGKLSVPHAILAKPGKLTDDGDGRHPPAPGLGRRAARPARPPRAHPPLGPRSPRAPRRQRLPRRPRRLAPRPRDAHPGGRRRLRRARLAARVPRGVGRARTRWRCCATAWAPSSTGAASPSWSC